MTPLLNHDFILRLDATHLVAKIEKQFCGDIIIFEFLLPKKNWSELC